MQPLSAHCMRTLLRFCWGSTHWYLCWGGVLHFQAPSACASGANLQALYDERHSVFECCTTLAVCVGLLPCLILSCSEHHAGEHVAVAA